jgi:hypothetical protein
MLLVAVVGALLAASVLARSTHPLDTFPDEIILHAPFSAFYNDSGSSCPRNCGFFDGSHAQQ